MGAAAQSHIASGRAAVACETGAPRVQFAGCHCHCEVAAALVVAAR